MWGEKGQASTNLIRASSLLSTCPPDHLLPDWRSSLPRPFMHATKPAAAPTDCTRSLVVHSQEWVGGLHSQPVGWLSRPSPRFLSMPSPPPLLRDFKALWLTFSNPEVGKPIAQAIAYLLNRSASQRLSCDEQPLNSPIAIAQRFPLLPCECLERGGLHSHSNRARAARDSLGEWHPVVCTTVLYGCTSGHVQTDAAGERMGQPSVTRNQDLLCPPTG
ncbi:hypothetical protein B0I37DRAFT_4334 [Chaetomium sp. MPI-CAGE-AT-0009]|nr:hypothetical protein B0I37DRAFT_4334 [Chaetomium sp. MPI-CAGE-AT-0009]